MKPIICILVAICLYGLAVSAGTAQDIVSNACNGYCATQGTCPQTGHGCNPPVCCYCCTTCGSICGTSVTQCATTPDGHPIYYDIQTTNLIYNCYQGANCAYTNTESTSSCTDGSCLWCPNTI